MREELQAQEDVQLIETSLSELHRRYDRLRSAHEEYKKNEDSLREALKRALEQERLAGERTNRFMAHTRSEIDRATNEIARLRKANEAETLGLRAENKKFTLQVDTLTRSLEAKVSSSPLLSPPPRPSAFTRSWGPVERGDRDDAALRRAHRPGQHGRRILIGPFTCPQLPELKPPCI